VRITGYFFGKRTEYVSLEDAWVCGSQLVCLSRNEDMLRYADITSNDRLEEWLNNGLAAGIFKD
jgi:hypothetical protein